MEIPSVYAITINIDPNADAGYATVDATIVHSPYYVLQGEEVTFYGGAYVGYVFRHWADGVNIYPDEEYTFTPTQDCTLTVVCEAEDFALAASPNNIDFGKEEVGYTAPEAELVTVTNTGNVPVELIQPEAEDYLIGTLSKTELMPGDRATFTIQPKEGLGKGDYTETIYVYGKEWNGGYPLPLRCL